MNKMNNINKFTDKEWEEIALHLSEEDGEQTDLLKQFRAEDSLNTVVQWKELKKLSGEREIDVDKAWNKVAARLKVNIPETGIAPGDRRFTRSIMMRVAAVALIILTLGATVIYLNNSGYLSRTITASTGNDQKNLRIDLPDGSKVFLNRNTELSYRSNFGKDKRQVKLTGEAFFDISADASKPFSVDAGNAKVKVLGTSFNIITNNAVSAVEVYVLTGKVMLSDNSGSNEIVLDPEYVGTMNLKTSEKTLNDNPNYMAWNTGRLVYNGEKLSVVFKDLKRFLNMDIVADNTDILDYPITFPVIDNESQDVIISLICASFNLDYSKEGSVYHLVKK